jgi:hypothetical protein
VAHVPTSGLQVRFGAIGLRAADSAFPLLTHHQMVVLELDVHSPSELRELES